MIQISSTGLPHADRARLENSVRALGGAYAGDLTDRTTHLVATKIHPRSAKLACALKLGLPIVLPQWVHASGTALSEPGRLTQGWSVRAAYSSTPTTHFEHEESRQSSGRTRYR